MNNEMINIGEIIKNRKENVGMTDAELSRRLGTSRQNIARLLKQSSMDTGQLYRFGIALEYDFFQHFSLNIPQQNIDKKAKILIEFEINSDEILKLGIKNKVLEILNK